MDEVARNRRFLSLRWKGFAGVSLILLALSGALCAFNYHSVMDQYRAQRHAEVQSFRRQIDALFTRSSERLVRLGRALASTPHLGETLRARDTAKLSEMVAAVHASDVSRIELYTTGGEMVWSRISSDTAAELPDPPLREAIGQVRSEEGPVILLSCRRVCLFQALVPIFEHGENVGVVVLGQAIADVVTGFRVANETDVALMMPLPVNAENALHQWEMGIIALSDAAGMTPFLKELSNRYPQPDALDNGQTVEWHTLSYDVHRLSLQEIMPGQTGYIVLISDVTERLRAVRHAIRQALFWTAVALAAAELSLLYVVGIPVRRLERFASTEPLLAKGAYEQAREKFSLRRKATFLRDEIDVSYETVVALCHQLEGHSRALATRNRELAQMGGVTEGLFASAQVMVLTQTRDGVIQDVNEFAAQSTGYAPERLRGRRFVDLIGDVEAHGEIVSRLEALSANGQKRLEHQHELVRSDGERRQVVWVHTPLRAKPGDAAAVLSVGLDVTDRAKAESRMRWLANHDPLTGLFNRYRFLEELGRALNEAFRTQATAALLLLDLDRFKEINDTGGHAAGDKLLRLFAGELRALTRKSDIVARLGGDEFAVLMPQTEGHGAATFAQKLNERLRKVPFAFAEKRYQVGASIGVALLPQHGANVQELLANADTAMYEAKNAGRSCCQVFAYDEEHGEALREGVYWKIVLTRALIEGHLSFQFQPVVDAATGAIVHHEALLRLRMGDGRIALPGEFLEPAQRAGLTGDLDLFVVHAAMKMLSGDPAKRLSINLSATALSDARWSEPLIEAVRERRLDPARLILEFTETAVIADMDKAKRIAEGVAGLGFGFALDDFGAGFSPLYSLKHLPVSYVKIDPTLVKNLGASEGDRDFVRAVITMVHAYGKRVIGKGVEDAATLALLRELGVDLVQGFHIGRPSETGHEAASGSAPE